MKKLFPYFTKWFKTGLIILGITLILKAILIGNFQLKDLKVIIFLIVIGAVAISILCGLAEYYFVEIWKPRKIKRIMLAIIITGSFKILRIFLPLP